MTPLDIEHYLEECCVEIKEAKHVKHSDAVKCHYVLSNVYFVLSLSTHPKKTYAKAYNLLPIKSVECRPLIWPDSENGNIGLSCRLRSSEDTKTHISVKEFKKYLIKFKEVLG